MFITVVKFVAWPCGRPLQLTHPTSMSYDSKDKSAFGAYTLPTAIPLSVTASPYSTEPQFKKNMAAILCHCFLLSVAAIIAVFAILKAGYEEGSVRAKYCFLFYGCLVQVPLAYSFFWEKVYRAETPLFLINFLGAFAPFNFAAAACIYIADAARSYEVALVLAPIVAAAFYYPYFLLVTDPKSSLRPFYRSD